MSFLIVETHLIEIFSPVFEKKIWIHKVLQYMLVSKATYYIILYVYMYIYH